MIPSSQPARPVVSRSPHRRVGYIPLPWLQNELIAYESLLEAAFVRWACLCPTLRKIRHQPFRLDLGTLGTYVPDYLLECTRGNPVVIEVKPRAHVAKHRAKLEAAQDTIERARCDFLVCTEDDIHAYERAERAAEFLRFARSALTSTQVSEMLQKLQRLEFPVGKHRIVSQCDIPRAHVNYLIGRKHLALASTLSTDRIFTTEGVEHGFVSARTWLTDSER